MSFWLDRYKMTDENLLMSNRGKIQSVIISLVRAEMGFNSGVGRFPDCS